MELNLKGKTALVTGSTRGIGLSIAQTLHSQGCRVGLNGRDKINLEIVTSQLPGTASFSGDVTHPSEAKRIVADVVSAFGKLDIVAMWKVDQCHLEKKQLMSGNVYLL